VKKKTTFTNSQNSRETRDDCHPTCMKNSIFCYSRSFIYKRFLESSPLPVDFYFNPIWTGGPLPPPLLRQESSVLGLNVWKLLDDPILSHASGR